MPARKESRSRVADAGRAELPGVALRQLDALRRVGMAGQEVEAGVGGAGDAAEIAIGRHRLQEAAGGIGIVAGARRST